MVPKKNKKAYRASEVKKNKKNINKKRNNYVSSSPEYAGANNINRKSKKQDNFRLQAFSILLFSLSVLLTFIILIQGENLWRIIHNVILGLFGVCAILWPILLTYSSIAIALEKPQNSVKFKICMSIIVIILFCMLVYMFNNSVYQNIDSYWSILSSLYNQGTYNKGSGLVGGILGVPLLYLLGTSGARVLIILILFTAIMLLTRTSLVQLFRWLRKPVDIVVENIHISKNNENKLNDISIDIPLEDKKEIDKSLKSNKKLDNLKKVFDIKEFDDEAELYADANASSIKNKVNNIKLEVMDNKSDEYDNETCYPPIFLLKQSEPINENDVNLELEANARKLVSTLKSFNVETTIVESCRGPAVTRYELQPAAGVKISKITSLSDDIALNLAASGVRIEAPIPGKAAVGIEVPNKIVSVVNMRELITSNEFRSSKSKLTVILGKDISGNVVVADLSNMPHLLVAGSTGSGKSVCINSFIISLLYRAKPQEVKLLMIDPKVVELGVYNGIPHLLVPVVTDPRKAAGALNWAVDTMINRYKMFAEHNVRDLNSYNSKMIKLKNSCKNPKSEDYELMPQIVIIIDELADLMMAAPNEVEDAICRLAQMARAAGMHLVIATQRPSVDIITGLIKANIPSRIALAVSSQVDSRTILDMSGAEKLLGRGDMLFSPVGTSKPKRVQGCYVTDEEIENVIDYIKKSYDVDYDQQIIEEIEKNSVVSNEEGITVTQDEDPMLKEAIKCVLELGQASTSLLQRKLRLGYARAGRLIDQMEQMGVIGPYEGSKPRQVLITHQQWNEMCNKNYN